MNSSGWHKNKLSTPARMEARQGRTLAKPGFVQDRRPAEGARPRVRGLATTALVAPEPRATGGSDCWLSLASKWRVCADVCHGALQLQQWNAVADDEPVFVNASGEVRSITCVSPADPEVLQCAALEYVLQFSVSLPLIAGGITSELDVMTLHVGGSTIAVEACCPGDKSARGKQQ